MYLLREQDSNLRHSAYETELGPSPDHPAVYHKKTAYAAVESFKKR